MAVESKKFKVKGFDTVYTLGQLMNSQYTITWTNSSGEHREARHSQYEVTRSFDHGQWYYIDQAPPVHIEEKPTSALDKQVSGNHYKDCGIQPIEYIHANNLNYFEGNAVKYITRHRKKNGKADIEKAIHYLELLLEMEYKD